MFLRRYSVVLVLALVVASCGDAGDAGGAGDLVVPVSDFQENILADGEVTFVEYEEAKVAEIGCLRQLGYDVDPPILDAAGRGINVGINLSSDDAATEAALDKALTMCRNEYSVHVERAWYRSTELSREEQLVALESAKDCLSNAGVDVDSLTTFDDFYEFNRDPQVTGNVAAQDCLALFYDLIAVASEE